MNDTSKEPRWFMDEGIVLGDEDVPESADPDNFIPVPEGMRWECTNCGSCCGNVFSRYWLDVYLAEHIGDAIDGFCKYMDRDNGNRCRRYVTRPNICRGYPFIIKRTGDHYRLTVHNRCPGIGNGDVLDVHERLLFTLKLVEDDLDMDFIVTGDSETGFLLYRIK